MRFHLFLCGISIIALGLAAPRVLEEKEALGFLQGALTLGGGLVISGLFATRWYWHGLVAGGVLALLGFSRGLINLPHFPAYLRARYHEGDLLLSPLPALETAITLICGFLLIGVVKILLAEKRRRALEALEALEAEETEE